MNLEKTYNYFYKITNTIDGKYYYGIHSTNNLNDGYMGGGTLLRRAQKKYGKNNFIKEIIAYYTTRKEASDHEHRVVTVELIELDECYNLRVGGENQCYPSISTRELMSKAATGENNGFWGKKHSEETIEKLKNINGKSFLGKKHTDETKRKLSESRKGKSSPNKGKKCPEHVKEAISKANAGRKHSNEAKAKMSQSRVGEKNHFYGKHHTPDVIEIIKEKRKLQIISEETKLKQRLNCPQAKKCSVDGKIFINMTQCALHFAISKDIVKRRLKSDLYKWKDWFFVTNIDSTINNNTTEIGM